MLYEISDQDVKNIRTFLDRVDLKGNEAGALVSVRMALTKPLKKAEPEKKAKKK